MGLRLRRYFATMAEVPICPYSWAAVRGREISTEMLSQLQPFYMVSGIIAVVVFFAAMLAEGRGAHIVRLVLTRSGREAVEVLRDEALTGDVPREPNNLNVIAVLGASERRYAEIDAGRARAEERAALADAQSSSRGVAA